MSLFDRENFPSVGGGLWWAVQTVTTVGYGDYVPENVAGRVVATVVMLGGIGFLTVITASITSGFVARAQRQRADAGQDPAIERLAALDDRLARIEQQLEELSPRA